jgi:hypothetical protein
MGECDEDAGGINSNNVGYISGQCLLQTGFKNAVIERKDHSGFREWSIVRFQPQQAGGQWSMHSGGLIVQCRTPHTMIDPDGWSDITSPGSSAAAKLWQLN